MPWLFAAAELLMFVLLEPVLIEWRLCTGEKPRAWLRFGALRVPLKKPKSGKKPSLAQIRTLVKLSRAILPRVRLRALRLSADIALGDAAKTALAFGAASALCEAVRAASPDAFSRLSLRPDFGGAHCRVAFSGMAGLSPGQAVAAALSRAVSDLRGR